MKEIPIQNIYYLLCYAWNRLDEGGVVDVSSLEGSRPADLFARVLSGGTRHLLRRGLDRGYLPFTEETTRIRGKVDFSGSLKRDLLARARALCEFDELDYNVLHNRILKTTAERLSRVEGLDRGLREEVRASLRWLGGVEPIRVTSQIFRRVQLHRNNHYYAFLMNVCELIHDNLLVEERGGASRFRDFVRDEGQMGRLFEGFVRNFYRLELKHYKVEAPKVGWQAEWATVEAGELLPEMRTDVCLSSPGGRKIIVECKYYTDTLQQGRYKKTVHSKNLYQLFTYVKNKAAERGWEGCEGVLLYPEVDRELKLDYKMQGHDIAIRTVDLGQEWFKVREEMLHNIGLHPLN